ncbi:protein kinase [Embleya sp. NPDC059237]|uniref:serine/threonine-protein kinase n=1 Tax=Embleya sp. NPDC059237 TaxID=3346784 RepID=UPI0036CAB497
MGTGSPPTGRRDGVGRRIGPYLVERPLGEGGMGRVYLARPADDAAGRPVAVKVIHPHLSRDPSFRARFAREVAAARAVRSPHLVPLVAADPQAEEQWLATAYVQGPSLREVVDELGGFGDYALRGLGVALAGALRDIHAAGLVHRDLKPSNVLMDADEGPLVIDLGIARAADATKLTGTGVLVGTPGYMAPEQLILAGSAPPADVFALGAVLAFAATGRRPFGVGPAHVVGYRVTTCEPDLEGAADWILPILLGCLAKDPAQRSTPDDVIAFLDPKGYRASPSPAPVRVRRWRPVLAAVTSLAVAVGAGVAMTLGDEGAAPDAAGGPSTTSTAPAARPPVIETAEPTASAYPPAPKLPDPTSALTGAASPASWTRAWNETFASRDVSTTNPPGSADGPYAIDAWLTDRVLVGVGGTDVRGTDPDTGRRLWTLRPPGAGMYPCQAARDLDGNVGIVIFGAVVNRIPTCDRVVAVDISTGEALWDKPRPGRNTDHFENDASAQPVGVGHDRVVLRSGDVLTAWSLRDGALEWEHDLAAEGCSLQTAVVGPSTVAEGVMCGPRDRKGTDRARTIRSVNVADGRVRWTSSLPGGVPIDRIEIAEPVTVSLPGPGGDPGPLVVFDANGKPGPRLQTSQDFGALAPEERNHLQLAPAVFGWKNTVVVLVTEGGWKMPRGIAAVDADTGRVRWHRSRPEGGKTFILGVDDQGVLALAADEPRGLTRYALADGAPRPAGTLLEGGSQASYNYAAARLAGNNLMLVTGRTTDPGVVTMWKPQG